MVDTVLIPLTIVEDREFWQVQPIMEGFQQLHMPKFLFFIIPLLHKGIGTVLHYIWSPGGHVVTVHYWTG